MGFGNEGPCLAGRNPVVLERLDKQRGPAEPKSVSREFVQSRIAFTQNSFWAGLIAKSCDDLKISRHPYRVSLCWQKTLSPWK